MKKELLEELATSKKKNDLSVARKKEFRSALEDTLRSEGITEDTERYILSCANLGSGISFFNWIQNMDELTIYELYTALVSTNGFRENANMNAARVLLTLIITSMGTDKKFLYITADAIKRVPDLLLTKDGMITANSDKIVINCFIENVGVYQKWYSLNDLDLTEAKKRQFLLIVKNAMDKYKPKNENQEYAFQNLSLWIKNEMSELETVLLSSTTGRAQSNNESDRAVKKPVSEKESEQSSSETLQGQPESVSGKKQEDNTGGPENTQTKKRNMSKKLAEFIQYVNDIETENAKMLAEIASLKHERSRLQQLYERTKVSSQEKESEVARLTKAIENVEQQLEEKEKKITELEMALQKQNDVYSIYSTDSENKHIEKMNAIAAKLKGEYKDFLEAQKMEMTIDLGLNLRDQLEDVFNILINNGINIKGR